MNYPEDLKPAELDWSRTNPCSDCPFLKSPSFHEGVASSIPVVVRSIQDNAFCHTCHKTDNRPTCDGPRNYPGKAQHCAGAILMLLKTARGMDLQLPLLQAVDRGDIDLSAWIAKAKSMENIYTLWEFIRFYEVHLLELKNEMDDSRIVE